MDSMPYREGQVIELWGQFDDLGLSQQLGLFKEPEEAQTTAYAAERTRHSAAAPRFRLCAD